MDFSDSIKMAFLRIKELDPFNAPKILGHLLQQDQVKEEIVRVAFGPDNVFWALVEKAKRELQSRNLLTSMVPTGVTPFTPASALSTHFQAANGQVAHFGSPMMNPYSTWHPATNQMPSMNNSMQYCPHFCQGYCPYGGNCELLHAFHMGDGHVMAVNRQNGNEVVSNNENNHAMTCIISLKYLEKEIIQVLKATRGVPVPLTALPVLYGEKYGKILQVEGHMMQGEDVFCTLTQMLTVTTCIRLMERPHGHRCLILVDDVPRYLRFLEERSQADEELANSCRVFLVFPQGSKLVEQHLANYFNKFGPVHDVFIPNLKKRTYGFVTFVYPETVILVLVKGKRHIIHGVGVQVNPFPNQQIPVDRMPKENAQHPMYGSSSHFQAPESKPVAFPMPEPNGLTSSQPNQLNTDRKGKGKMHAEVPNGSICIEEIKQECNSPKSSAEIIQPDSPLTALIRDFVG